MYKILVPVDGSNHSLKALHIACDLANKYDARIILLHVLSANKQAQEILGLTIANMFDTELKKELQKVADRGTGAVSTYLLEAVGEKVLEIAASRVHRVGIKSEILAIARGNPAKNIIQAHKMVGASTIVMGCRGSSGSSPSSFGSVSQQVFEQAECTCVSVK